MKFNISCFLLNKICGFKITKGKPFFMNFIIFSLLTKKGSPKITSNSLKFSGISTRTFSFKFRKFIFCLEKSKDQNLLYWQNPIQFCSMLSK